MHVEIIKNLYKMQQNRDGTDCCFAFEVEAENSMMERETQFIYAHKLVLSAASSVFKTMFSEHWNKDEKIVLKEISFESFDAIIKAIYTGSFEFDDLEGILSVLTLAHMYQIDSVVKQANEYVVKLFNGTFDMEEAIFPLLNHACLHKNMQLKEFCLTVIQSNITLLQCDSFLHASPEVVNLIFSLDQLNIDSEIELVDALKRYLQAHPVTRSELEDAIYNIRFLSLCEADIKSCNFLDTKTTNQLIKLKENPGISFYDLEKFSKKRETRPDYKLFLSLPTNIVMKLIQIFNDRTCFICQKNHSSLSCQNFKDIYKPDTVLDTIYSQNDASPFLENYSNCDIRRILRAFRKVAINEETGDKFVDFLDLPIYI